MLNLRPSVWTLVSALALMGATCGGQEIEISELRVDMPERYAPAAARVSGQITLPTQVGGTVSGKITFGDGFSMDLDVNTEGQFAAAHTFENPGHYDVTVEVKASNGATGQRAVGVTVEKALADAAFECVTCDSPGNCSPVECTGLGKNVTFRGSSTGGIGSLRYRWSFGDGQPDADGEVVSHEFRSSDTYTVTMVVLDAVSSSAFVSRDVEVTDVQAALVDLTLVTTQPRAEQELSVKVKGSGVPTMTLYISWGDTSSTVVADYSGDGSDSVSKHTYTAAGTYTVTVTAEDALGQQATDTLSVQVAAAP